MQLREDERGRGTRARADSCHPPPGGRHQPVWSVGRLRRRTPPRKPPPSPRRLGCHGREVNKGARAAEGRRRRLSRAHPASGGLRTLGRAAATGFLLVSPLQGDSCGFLKFLNSKARRRAHAPRHRAARVPPGGPPSRPAVLPRPRVRAGCERPVSRRRLGPCAGSVPP